VRGPEDVVVVAVMMAVMMAMVPGGPENVVMTTMVSMVSMMPPMMPVMSVMPPVVAVMPPVASVMAMMTSGGPEDVSVTFPPAIFVIFLGGRIFLLFRIHVWMDDVMNIIGDDKHHLSVGEELVKMFGGHLQMRDELDHLLGDVLRRGRQLHHRHVFSLLVSESRVP